MKSREGFSIIALVAVVAILGLAYVLYSTLGSEKLKASISVLKSDSENTLVDFAGKSKVAEEIAIKRIEDLRKKLVKIKALKRKIARHIDEPTTSSEAKARYTELISRIVVAEKKAEDAYKNANQNLENLRVKLEIIDTEISIAKASSAVLSTSSGKGGVLKSDLEKILNSLSSDLDTANSELDVALMETDM